MPYTLVLNDKNQCEEFILDLKSNKKTNWIYKIARYSHNGKGLNIVDSEFSAELLKNYTESGCPWTKNVLVQKYITNPLLLKGKKFDFRAYLFIASMDPLILLYHDGFLRISMEDYDENSSNPDIYLTNTHIAENNIIKKNLTWEKSEQLLEDQG